MALYYIWHTFKNGVKRLFKTWLAIFLVIIVVFGGIGYLIGTFIGNISDNPGEGPSIEEPVDPDIPSEPEKPGLWETERDNMLEGISTLATLLLIAFICMGADKKGSQIFLPADINILFTSPLKPQSVLLFRLIGKLFTFVFIGLYMVFQLPNLVVNAGLSVWTAVSLLIAFIFVLVFGELLQVLLYTICSTKSHLKKYISLFIYSIFGVLIIIYALRVRVYGRGFIDAAFDVLNFDGSRLIPIIGWIKGLIMASAEGNVLSFILYIAACVVGGVLLLILIWSIKADFYEDAMSKTEEIAEMVEAAQSGRKAMAKKEHSEKIERDGFSHGWGANVFFYKTIYNRFRFSKLKYFTKTTYTYMAISIAASCMMQFVIKAGSIIYVGLILAVSAFYRSLGNPYAEDTQVTMFQTIPEKAGKKIFWSILGGSANSFLDMLPGMIIAVFILGDNPLMALGLMLFVCSMDFYSTSVGTFIGLSSSLTSGKTIKLIIQIMFIYLGVIPDAIVFIVICLAFGIEMMPLATVISAGVNILIGWLFCGLSAKSIEPKNYPILDKTYSYHK